MFVEKLLFFVTFVSTRVSWHYWVVLTERDIPLSTCASIPLVTKLICCRLPADELLSFLASLCRIKVVLWILFLNCLFHIGLWSLISSGHSCAWLTKLFISSHRNLILPLLWQRLQTFTHLLDLLICLISLINYLSLWMDLITRLRSSSGHFLLGFGHLVLLSGPFAARPMRFQSLVRLSHLL